MELLSRVVAAERLEGGLLLTFEDDVCAFYSGFVLRSILSQARVYDDEALDVDEPLLENG